MTEPWQELLPVALTLLDAAGAHPRIGRLAEER
jgi:hypothetical protein